MRSWHVKPKGLAPAKCTLTKSDYAFCAFVGVWLAVIMAIYLAFC